MSFNQLVSNNIVGVQNNHILVDNDQHELENQPPHMSHIQTIFVPLFTSPPEGVFTYPIPNLPQTYPNSILINTTNN